jgi:putative sugar O-methyltransferase
MFEEMALAPEVFRPSAFWQHLNEHNVEQLRRAGFSRFKRTINQNYFGWVPTTPADPQFRSVLRDWLAHPSGRPLAARLTSAGGVEAGDERRNPFARTFRRRAHAVYLALLWEFVRRRDALNLLGRLEEPGLGDPITAEYQNRRISQDLCNSALELYAMTTSLDGGPPKQVLEVGPGYGRLAWLCLQAYPSCRYVLVDIPPALAVAQAYLTTLFPDHAVFAFRHFNDYAEISDEFESAQIAFLTPNQLDRIPALGVDLFVNVSSFHEMRPAQILRYFELIELHCRGYFYSKQWLISVNPYDGVVIRQGDYPIPSRWERIFSRLHPVQRMFFEELYRVR